jgi:hypothetical protein
MAYGLCTSLPSWITGFESRCPLQLLLNIKGNNEKIYFVAFALKQTNNWSR